MKAELQEKVLLYRVQTNKDPDSYAALYDQYVAPVYRFVYFKLSHRQEAEDATSEIFLKCWQYLTSSSGKEIRNFRSLIYAIARNKVVDIYRERARRKEDSLDTVDESDDGLAKHFLELSTENERLLQVIKKLKQEYQEVILFKYIEDLSVTEIARMTGKSAIGVRVTLHRALKKLRELL
ncbi:MAG: sigma-70 family RNA polymerase sigma factor [Patescibacteria group bacterium]